MSVKVVKFKLVSHYHEIHNHPTNASAGDIGRSMLLGERDNFARDIEAVYSIAATLLDFPSNIKLVHMSGLAADQFMKMPLRISPKELLKVRNLSRGHAL
jgi:hypothetical protein